MPKVIREFPPSIQLICDDPEDRFVARYTNEGEPFREGIKIGIENADFEKDVQVMLEEAEAKALRDFLIKMYPIN